MQEKRSLGGLQTSGLRMTTTDCMHACAIYSIDPELHAVTSCAASYTLGPGLRIPIIKNMGKALALEELRICPWPRGWRS